MIKTIMIFWGRICAKGDLAMTVGKNLSPKLGRHHEHIAAAYLKHCWDYQIGKLTAKQFWTKVQKELDTFHPHEKLVRHHLEARDLNKGVMELLKKLKKGHRLMLLTNTYKEYFEHAHKKYRLDTLFDDIVLSYKIKNRLPHPKAYTEALKKAKCRPSECLVIMDKQHFLTPAKAKGMKTILYKNKRQLEKDLKRLGVKW